MALMTEESTTNYVRNSVAAGTLGVGQSPTNWQLSVEAGVTMTRTLVEDTSRPGHNVMEVRLQNTSGTTKNFWCYFDAGNVISSVSGDAWSVSADVWVVAGSINNSANFGCGVWWNNAAVAYIGEGGNDVTVPLTRTRIMHENRVAIANTAWARPGFRIYGIPDGTDVTLRIGTPQLEKRAYATTYQASTGSSSSRATENANENTALVSSLPTGSWTVEGYVMLPNLISLTGAHLGFFGARNSSGVPRVTVAARRGAGSYRFAVWDSTNLWAESSYSILAANQWVHLAVSYDGGTVRMYANGAPVGSSVRALPSGTYNEFYFGRCNSSSEYLDGSVSDLRIYNRALADAEIVSIYNGFAVDDGLVNHWTLDSTLESGLPQGRATVVGSGVQVYDAQASLSSTGSTVSGSAITAVGAAVLAGSATVAPNANVLYAAKAAPVGVATVSAAPLLFFAGKATLGGVATIGAKAFVPVDDYLPTTRIYAVHPRHSHSKE